MKPTDSQSSKITHLRRSQRVCISLPVVVFREGRGNNIASEETHTLIVNAHGALILLALTVEVGQLLRIKNTQTMEELLCRVAHVSAEQSGKREVGVDFEAPSPRFWRITFPPSDWTPRSPDAKAPTKHIPGGRVPLKKTAQAPNIEKSQIKKLPGSVPG